MHKKYLQRLMKEVPFDAIEVDDMCSYPGNTTCGCKYCRDRRLEADPPHAMEAEDVVSRPNNWEKTYSDLHYREGSDLVEIRVVNNGLCRENGWRDEKGREHWDRSKAWSIQLVGSSVGYRFVRAAELADSAALIKETTPLVLDGVGCVSDRQFAAIKTYLAGGGTAWLALPFGSHDERGFLRKTPLSAELLQHRYKNLRIIDSSLDARPLEKLIAAGFFKPVLRQIKGDRRWAARIRFYNGVPAIHFMNTGLVAIPDEIKDLSGIPLMKDIDTLVKDNDCSYEIDTRALQLPGLSLMSPELAGEKRPVTMRKSGEGRYTIGVDLEGIKIYGVAQSI